MIDFLYQKINYFNKTINQYLNEKPKEIVVNLTQIKIQWDKYYKEFMKNNNININSNDKIKPNIYERKNIDNNINNSSSFNLFSNVNIEKNNLNYFNMDYMSFRPINTKFMNSEPVFLVPNLKHYFLWEKDKI